MRTLALLGLIAGGMAAVKPSVVHVIIDDLGYHDPNFRNGQVKTPVMDQMVKEGLEIPDFYVYKMCAPSRASVLTGRYPFNVGYYNNNGGANEGVPLSFKMLPELLKPAGYATHALGKWHTGWLFANYTPTYRGFDTFFGNSGNTGDYWYHIWGGSGNDCTTTPTPSGGPITDLVDVGNPNGVISPADMSKYNGTYDSRMLTDRAVEIISQNPSGTPFYMYLAYHNVHVPMHAPLETVNEFPYVTNDARKVTDAMLLEVDNGLAKIQAALTATDQIGNTIFIVHTDNGGPGSHACNYPLRGGKFTFWEGGVRGMAFISSPLLPKSIQGTKFNGQAHLSDVYLTVAEGIAGVNVDVNSTGPIQPDSVNIWDAVMKGTPSPRYETIHIPFSNKFDNTSDCGTKGPSHGCSPSMRLGDLKIIYGWPGEDSLITLTPLGKNEVAYGKTGGLIRFGNQAIGPHWKGYNQTHQHNTCDPFCVFNVTSDPGENHDLSKEKDIQPAIAQMNAKLQAAADNGPDLCEIVSKADYKAQYLPTACANVAKTGFWLPVNYDSNQL